MNPIAHYFREHATPLNPKPGSLAPVLPQLTGIKCVAFDIYGTLIISQSGDIGSEADVDHSDLLRTILLEAGAKAIPKDPGASFNVLIETAHKAAYAKGIEHPEVDILAIWTKLLALSQAPPAEQEVLKYFAARYELATNPVWPMPEAKDLLAELKNRGIRMGIVSNAQFYTPPLFEAFFGGTVEELGFDPGLCFYSYQHQQAKPGTWLYQQLRDALAVQEIEPEETLYLGNDALKDVHPAASLGFKTALFAGDQRSLRLREDLPNLRRPDAVVTALGQITGNILPPAKQSP